MAIKLTFRIWVLIISLILSAVVIIGFPFLFLQKGVLITSVEDNSAAFDQGLRKDQVIIEIDGKEIESLQDYSSALDGKFIINQSVKTILQTSDGEVILFSDSPPEVTVSELPKTNIKTGLDISGGARALVETEDVELTSEEIDDLISVVSNRLNVYGLEDVKVSKISDLSGIYYMKVEIAGATPKDLENLISQQGKFEAKVGNETVFVGGEEDITSVSRSGQDAIIESCQQANEGYFCNFRFTIFLSEKAAKKHAEVTGGLSVNTSTDGNYLSESLNLYLDDRLVDTLLISESLKGQVTTQISISGSGVGASEEEALQNARDEMSQLQTVLITGSLPYKLKISKLDTISPSLGNEFVKSILIAGFSALLVVSIVVFIRYRNIKASLALLLTSISELIIILGIASFIKWNLDIPSIAGILATIGTGLDQQIIILDESKNKSYNMAQRMKRAFGIILGAYFTVLVAMLPLYWAAAGFFKGFAITTIIGITAGVLITRPAFSDMVKKFEE